MISGYKSQNNSLRKNWMMPIVVGNIFIPRAANNASPFKRMNNIIRPANGLKKNKRIFTNKKMCNEAKLNAMEEG